jgi:PhoH-like ATPase
MYLTTVIVPDQMIDLLYAKQVATYEHFSFVEVNEYCIFVSNSSAQKQAFVRYLGTNNWQRIEFNRKELLGISPGDNLQNALVHALELEDISVYTVTGTAGTGKTTLALAYALDQLTLTNKTIFLSKPAIPVGSGRAFGPVPGDINEKYAPYIASYTIILEKLLGKRAKAYIDLMLSKKSIEFIPTEMTRGCTFENCTFILDEAQNLTWHELNTVVSRIGQDAKILITGDLEQIDTKFKKQQSGLYQLINSVPYQQSPLSMNINLMAQYRSAITQLLIDVDKWIKNGSKRKPSS